MDTGIPQLILALALLIALVLLVLTGHNNDNVTQAMSGALGVAIGFFFRDAMSKINNRQDRLP